MPDQVRHDGVRLSNCQVNNKITTDHWKTNFTSGSYEMIDLLEHGHQRYKLVQRQ